MTTHTIGTAVLDRLHRLGVRHIFGIPGDYVLGLYKLMESSPIQHVATTREDCAGFAADAYARINGIGALCVTYCVGGRNTVNAIACAYAERSPVVLLTGSPGLSERARNPYLHHMVREFSTQREVFEKMTVAAVSLEDPLTAEREMDRAFAALLRYRRPIYLEIPRDMVHVPLAYTSHKMSTLDEPTDKAALSEAVAEVRAMLASAKRPVILAGAEVGRFGLHDELTKLVERLNVPIASTLLGKSIIREDHPLDVGVPSGLVARDEVKEFVNQTDCLLILGSILSDVEDLDARSALFSDGHTIHATADRVAIKHHRYDSIRFEDPSKDWPTHRYPHFPSRSCPPRASRKNPCLRQKPRSVCTAYSAISIRCCRSKRWSLPMSANHSLPRSICTFTGALNFCRRLTIPRWASPSRLPLGHPSPTRPYDPSSWWATGLFK
ncbi:MAG: thiamine pyrophosphate-binding protein [Nitrospira sp.]